VTIATPANLNRERSDDEDDESPPGTDPTQVDQSLQAIDQSGAAIRHVARHGAAEKRAGPPAPENGRPAPNPGYPPKTVTLHLAQVHPWANSRLPHRSDDGRVRIRESIEGLLSSPC